MKRLYDIDYRECNRKKIQLYGKIYFQNNKEELYEKSQKKDEDINFRLVCNLRKRLLNAFEAQIVRKTNKTFDLLGCSHSF